MYALVVRVNSQPIFYVYDALQIVQFERHDALDVEYLAFVGTTRGDAYMDVSNIDGSITMQFGAMTVILLTKYFRTLFVSQQ